MRVGVVGLGRMGGTLAERLVAAGIALVSGGVLGAREGTLTVMAAGSDADLDRVQPLLEVFGRVVRVGAVGAGHAVKALNNLLSASHLLLTSEAVLAAERFGVEPAVLLDVVNGSSGRSGSSELNGRATSSRGRSTRASRWPSW